MKHIKKLLALVLSVLMALSMATSVFAAEDDPETFDITITAPTNGSLEGHTYNVYQIFTGELATGADGKEILSNIACGENYGPKTEVELDALLTQLSTMSGEAAAAMFNKDKKGDPFTVLNKDNAWTEKDAPAGYYLIIDVSTNLPQGETSSAFILELIDDTTITSKHTAGPKVEKKIHDTNDSTEAVNEETVAANWENITWHDSADHDIGDAIPFKLEMTVPANFDEFKTYGEAYRFVFHDTEEKGLTFNNDAKVYVDGNLITTGYEVVVNPEDKCTFDVVFADLTKVDGVDVDSVISVVYTSTLNENAVLGSQGNVNKVYGEYSNLHRPQYPSRTPDDTVIAFTYKVVVNKVDQSKNPLAGAEFSLKKYDALTETWVEITRVTVTEGTVFTFKGLDDGQYMLEETLTPAGYNTIDPIEFTVTADHDIEWKTQTRLEVLNSLGGKHVLGELEEGEVAVEEIKFNKSESEGSLTTDVVNKSGSILPETGGIGVTIFYALGGAMVLAAVVLLVTKRRMDTTK